jgi:hypothetical protein
MKPRVHNLSKRLYLIRKQWFKSQQAFANRCHELGVPVTLVMISDWENSKNEIPARLIPFLAHALNIEVADLLPTFNPAELGTLPLLLPLPTPGKPVKPATEVRPAFATRRLAVDNAIQKFGHRPCRSAHVSSNIYHLNPFEHLVWHDNRTLLMALLRALDRRYRHVILWYYFGGLIRQQIAAKLNRSVDLVSLRLREGRSKLRRFPNCEGGSHWLRREFIEQFAPLDRDTLPHRQEYGGENWTGKTPYDPAKIKSIHPAPNIER